MVLGLLVFLAALYPFMATRAKVADRWNPDAPHSLDGMDYMQYVDRYENNVGFSLKPDYEALRWLQANVTGTPVELEAQTIEYNWGSRVTVYTGFPTVIGWNWHQRQQLGWLSDEVWLRVSDVAEAYNTPDADRAIKILDKYHVNLIIVGALEHAYYDATGLGKFDRMIDQGMLRLIYERDGTKIYEVLYEQGDS